MFEKKIIKNIPRNKKAFSAITLLLILAISMMTFSLPSFAQVGVPQPNNTKGYISVAPTLVGVDQNATLNLWVFPLPTTYIYSPYFNGFTGLTVTFVKPDGTKDTFAPVDGTGQYVAGQLSSLGSMYFFYAPDMVGDWSVSFTMPEQNITDSTGTVLYTGCTSNTAYFTVQTDPVNAGLLNGYPWSQLPNENTFWKYPINSNNREWYAISGDWLQGSGLAPGSAIHSTTSGLWQPYGSGPNTGHIVWSQSIATRGLIGGDYGSLSYTTGFGSYSPVIIQGKIFANLEPTSNGGSSLNKFQSIDLTTGKILYTADGSIRCGIHLPGNAAIQSKNDPSVVLANSFGAIPTAYLFGTSGATWNYYEILTGKIVRTISNVTASSFKLVDGTNLAYCITGGNLTAWDVSKVVNNNWPTGVTWTQPLPATVLNGTKSLVGSRSILGLSPDASVIVLKTINEYWGFNAKEGSSLWNMTVNYPVSANQQLALFGVDDFIVFDPTATTFHCYSMKTGAQIWESESFSDSPWATTWTVYNSITNDYDNLYVMFPDGTMTAIRLGNGETLWRSNAIASTELTSNTVPFVCGMVMEGGNIYGYAGYSVIYQIDPMPRNSMLVCINATTGDITYTLNGGVYPSAAANGYVIGFGQYDGNLYCIGKGLTSTSVTIQNDVVANHATILIKGNVLDQSPASAGTPAVADASMSEWMDYLHMQNATLLNNPPTPQGVTVKLTAVDPNGNTINVGTTTTDSKGNYAINFNPENVGIYTIKVSFAGTNAYFSSDSEAKLSVIAAPEYTPTASASNTGISETTLYTAVGAVIAVVVIFGVLLALLMLRKRP